ncbi:MAG TPA: AraC family transcriptional regulator [Longimicrobium sp.]|nr:AraC family transcriptional regulator [Longimicrobium sp.]
MTFDSGGAGSAVHDPEAIRREALRVELAGILERRTGADGRHETAIPALKLWRFSHPTEPAHALQEPAVYVVVQGRKQVTLGDAIYVYDRSQYLAVSVELPVVSNVLEASPGEPYLCITLTVDPRELAALIVETGRQAPRDDHDGRALYVSALRTPLLDGLLRLVRLLDAPEEIPVLAPLVLREVNYRLLQSEQFGRLAQMAIGDGPPAPGVRGDRLDQGALRGTAAGGGAREPGAHEPVGAAPPLQGGDVHEPHPVSEAAAAAGGSPPAAVGRAERGRGRLRGGVRERIAVQPRIRPALRPAAASRHRARA